MRGYIISRHLPPSEKEPPLNTKLCTAVLTVLAGGLLGCGTYTLTKDALVNQLKENQSSKEVFQYIPSPASLFLDPRYESNGIRKVLCLNSKGEKVYLYPGKDTQLEITLKSTGDVVKMYFDTVFLVETENKIVGLRSRLIKSMTREVNLNDIDKIEITDEMPKTDKVE
jgi:hypothetical protein